LGAGDIVHRAEDVAASRLAMQRSAAMASFAKQGAELSVFDDQLAREMRALPDRIDNGIKKGFKNLKQNIYLNGKLQNQDHENYKKRGFTA
jgi:hypothetical protein